MIQKIREYYDTFLKDTLEPYDNWPEERWIDVSENGWICYVADRIEL